MFFGFCPAGSAIQIPVYTLDNNGTPQTPVGSPAYAIYGAGLNTPLLSGTMATNVNSVTGFCRDTPTLATGLGFASGTSYYVEGTYVIGSTTYGFDGVVQVV